MSWILRDKEYAALLSTPAAKRYEYWVKRVVDCEELWTLRTARGFAVMGDVEGHELVPVWPHRRFAEACASGGEVPEPISLKTWLTKWLPGMQKDHRLVAVFPIPSGNSAVGSPKTVLADLRKEDCKYE